jgi:hypothetical protein
MGSAAEGEGRRCQGAIAGTNVFQRPAEEIPTKWGRQLGGQLGGQPGGWPNPADEPVV